MLWEKEGVLLMINLKKIDKLQEDYLNNLTVPELKEYILNLSIEYYSSLASKDYDKFNLIIGTFEKIIDLNSNYDVGSYISFCLINVFNSCTERFVSSGITTFFEQVIELLRILFLCQTYIVL